MERCLELLDGNQTQRNQLFNNPTYKPYLLLTYQQFKSLFHHDEFNLPRFNKMIIYTDVDYYNYVYNQVWCYKWYPLIGKILWNSLHRRSTSILFSFIYIGSMELFLERFFMFQYVDQKLIDVSNYFTAPLIRPKYQKKREDLFQKYKEMIKQDFQDNHYEKEYKPRDWVILGNKFNIHYPYVHWTESRDQSKQDILQDFFLKNNQLPLLLYTIKSLGLWAYNTKMKDMQKQSQAYFQNIGRNITRMIQEFPVYKSFLPILPYRSKLNDRLSSELIDQRKRYRGMDEIKFLMSKTMNIYNYYAHGKNEFVRYEFKWFDPNISAKKPTYSGKLLV